MAQQHCCILLKVEIVNKKRNLRCKKPRSCYTCLPLHSYGSVVLNDKK
uniref:Uncharacterized protein n=1 Tax=Rhizophora mucronata TaxID=61149 RepID=A0A2P2NZW1_RHIMU